MKCTCSQCECAVIKVLFIVASCCVCVWARARARGSYDDTALPQVDVRKKIVRPLNASFGRRNLSHLIFKFGQTWKVKGSWTNQEGVKASLETNLFGYCTDHCQCLKMDIFTSSILIYFHYKDRSSCLCILLIASLYATKGLLLSITHFS